jgi:hypothetical protein
VHTRMIAVRQMKRIFIINGHLLGKCDPSDITDIERKRETKVTLSRVSYELLTLHQNRRRSWVVWGARRNRYETTTAATAAGGSARQLVQLIR